MYILAPNQAVETFPYSIGDLRRDNPGTSFPAVPTEQTLAEWNVFPVVDDPAPNYDPARQNRNQKPPSIRIGKWVREWEVVDATDAEILERRRSHANYRVFWDALLASTVYSAIRTQSMASLPMNTLATEFIALLGDAKAGRPNEAAIQASMEALLITGTFTQDHLTELGEALEAGKLDGIYDI